MKRRPMAVRVGAAVVGVALLLDLSVARGQSEATDGASMRTPWGEPNLAGVWKAEALGARPGRDTFGLARLEGLYTPEARARMAELSAADDPTLRCAPPAFPRAAMLGRPIQIVQSPGFAFVLTEAYPVYRIIPTTDRPHTEVQYLYPTYMGDSTGRWEGDTLVVDVISFNGEAWLAGPEDKPTDASTGVWPTSGEMHVVERWRRVDADTLEYQATVGDRSSLNGPWETPTITFERQAVEKIDEVLCLQDDRPETYFERLD